MDWPESVPVLSAESMCKAQMNGPNGEHCLLGWRNEVFGSDETKGYQSTAYQAYSAIMQVCKETWGAACNQGVDRSVIHANDYLATYEEAAEVWNEAMRRLGYTEISYEEPTHA